MTGVITVPKLKTSGKYASEIDWSDGFKDDTNPNGYFKLVVLPKETFDGYAIRYQKTDEGFLVEGEGYIVSGTAAEIDKKVDRHFRRFTGKNVRHIESNIR